MSFRYSSSGLFIPTGYSAGENFLFSYRKKKSSAQEQEEEKESSQNVKKAETSPYILVVEDDKDLIHSLDRIGEDKNIKMTFAQNGGEGVSLVSKHNFDAVILDWNLPDFDGDEFIALSDDLINLHSKKYNYNMTHRVPVITFSGEVRKNTHLDHSEHFYKVTHWKKPMSFNHMASILENTFMHYKRKKESQSAA